MPSLSHHQSNEGIEYIQRRFRHPVTQNENGCWIWEGPLSTNGYARVRNDTLHTIIWYIFYGPVPKGLEVCHRCCVKRCINPNHLYAGTRKQNMSDKDMQAVYRRIRKLDSRDYETISVLFSWGWPKTEIGKIVGVSGEHVGKFLRGGLKYAKPF